ncbi:DUF3331 domain-containing protein [Paraburkholderia sp. XV]|uniref:DUF3331 domain-containing protein n=1 Tax=Paraburkholderia sp. XV TaxID=2831520 RepID=UPI001CD7DD14|nr:DUF3331 domain-containing protein [Paraburkholderia sp. XV]
MMTRLVEEDIVTRALLAVLVPTPIESIKKAQYDPKKKFRKTKGPRPEAFEPVAVESPPAHVCILEQLSSKTLSVCWSDPRSGHYADQVWRFGLARMDSFCVLTGMPIRRGDAVFRPRACESHFPANCDRMILASAVPSGSPMIKFD